MALTIWETRTAPTAPAIAPRVVSVIVEIMKARAMTPVMHQAT